MADGNNGQLLIHLQADVPFDDLRIALSRTFTRVAERRARVDVNTNPINSSSRNDGPDSQSRPPGGAQPQPEAHNQAAEGNIRTTNSAFNPQGAASAPSDAQPSATTSNSSSPTLRQVMEDRRKRLEADKAAKDTAEKEKRKAVGQARRDAAAAAPSTFTSKQSLYAQEQRKRKQEAKAERERILRDIDNDRAARKEKEALRRAQVQAEAADAGNVERPRDIKVPQHWSASGSQQECSLQVRMFDGHTIRGKFAPEQTLNDATRAWIGKQKTDGDTPFTLKQILTPLPNRTITITEEEQSLESLGLLPNATLVMVPIQGYTGAYQNDRGIIGNALSTGYNAASAGGLILIGAVETVLGFGRTTTGTQSAAGEGNSQGDGSREKSWRAEAVQRKNFNTLKRQGKADDDDQQLYNGNQVWSDLSSFAGNVM
ncbi:MAG: hypothetical protein Q9222_000169 [Ikaeria aurantiellina]